MSKRNTQGPLRTSKIRVINECRYWERTDPPEIEPQEDDWEHIVKMGDVYDRMALEELGNDAMGHLIMHRNDTDDYPCRLWPNDFVPGRRIQVPTRVSLERRRII
jgi:hypothetical protein